MDRNRVKISHFAQKRIFRGILTFCLLIVPYHAAKFEKNFRADPENFDKVESFTGPQAHTHIYAHTFTQQNQGQ